jgi:hypothetical protein
MKALNRILITGIAAVAIFTGNVEAQRVVVGTGDPDIDIAAVQAAVDRGGSVVLRGHFSFDNPAREAAEEAAAKAAAITVDPQPLELESPSEEKQG